MRLQLALLAVLILLTISSTFEVYPAQNVSNLLLTQFLERYLKERSHHSISLSLNNPTFHFPVPSPESKSRPNSRPKRKDRLRRDQSLVVEVERRQRGIGGQNLANLQQPLFDIHRSDHDLKKRTVRPESRCLNLGEPPPIAHSPPTNSGRQREHNNPTEKPPLNHLDSRGGNRPGVIAFEGKSLEGDLHFSIVLLAAISVVQR